MKSQAILLPSRRETINIKKQKKTKKNNKQKKQNNDSLTNEANFYRMIDYEL